MAPGHEVRTCCFHNTKLPLLAQCRVGSNRRANLMTQNMREMCPPEGGPVSAGTVWAQKYFCSCWRSPTVAALFSLYGVSDVLICGR
ncbi:hypothetical protein KCP74_22950 [Salmonella enterica subsp. enterica]|nr:hypothetical protein KCP74_22950 [Salmonella enterica subsp. enterica]